MADRDIVGLNEDDTRLEVAQINDRYNAPRPIVAQEGIVVPSGQQVGDLDPEEAAEKLSLVDVTLPINLDDVGLSLQLLAGAMSLFPGEWDASGTGTYPPALRRGESWLLSSGALLDGREVKANDVLVYFDEGLPTSDGNAWIHLVQGREIVSVGGQAPDASGNIDLSVNDITGLENTLVAEDIDDIGKLRTVSNSLLDEATDSRPPQAHTHAQKAILSYTFSPRDVNTGDSYLGGFYEYSDVDANLTQGGTATIGNSNNPYGGFAFAVYGAGGTDGSTITLTVSGTSINDEGTLTPADSEILLSASPGSLSANDYFESTKRWVGEVTYTLTTDGVNATCDFNYGLCQYEKVTGNNPVDVVLVEASGMGNANDASFNMQLIAHKADGWTYAATGFEPGNVIADFSTDYGAFAQVVQNEQLSWRRSGTPLVTVQPSEGVLLKLTLGTNKALSYLNMSVMASFNVEDNVV
jgi:hypothetical protein